MYRLVASIYVDLAIIGDWIIPEVLCSFSARSRKVANLSPALQLKNKFLLSKRK